ncbi:MAG: FG-GAP-like repeat-containing protein [bacterium]
MRSGGLIVGILFACSVLLVWAKAGHAEGVVYDADQMGRLRRAAFGTGDVFAYEYDLVGNRTRATVGAPVPAVLFADVTQSALADSGHATGVAWLDLNGDGDLDLHVLRSQGETDLAYENQGAAGFTSLNSSVLADPGNGQGMDWGDYDNDGDLDVYLVNANSANKLLRNDGGGFFVDVTAPPLNYGCCDEGAAWIDYDRDGRLDLYLTTGSGQPNHLYRNLGGGSFSDVTPPALAITARCAASAWGDYDGDGDSDVYVSVVDGPNHLVRNDGGGSFTDVTVVPLSDTGAAQGAAWGDYDNDGDLDLYLCNFGQPNRLFRNDAGSFVDVATGSLADPNQGQSGTWTDFDNDRDLDLVLTNFGQPSYVLRNDGGTSFLPVTTIGDTARSLGAAWGDYDQDGDQDLFVANYGSSDKLFRNDVANGNHWLDVTLQGTVSNRAAIGARVLAVDFGSGVRQLREHGSNHGFWSCNAPAEHFGLGSSTQVDLLIVRWPSGIIDSLTNVASNRRITVVETEITDVATRTDIPVEYRLYGPIPNPFRNNTSIAFDLPRSGTVELRIYDVSGRLVRTLVGGTERPAGRYRVTWDGKSKQGTPAASGVYFCRLRAGSYVKTQRLTTLR